MRHGSGSRRPRSRNNNGRRNNNNHNGNPRTKTFDSNGPEVRIRGNAFQVNEKYLALAKDASSAGDLVLAESYLQHAEHYQRVMNDALASQPVVKPAVTENKAVDNKVSENSKETKDVAKQPAPKVDKVAKVAKVAPEDAAKNVNNPVAGLEAEDEAPKKPVRRKPRVKKEEVVEA